MDTSVTFKDLGDTMEIVFYGLSHGKNRYDGERGVIKARAARNIRHGEVISSAKDLYKSCLTLEKEESNPESNHNSRKLIWVDRKVSHTLDLTENAKVKGTRNVHSVTVVYFLIHNVITSVLLVIGELLF